MNVDEYKATDKELEEFRSVVVAEFPGVVEIPAKATGFYVTFYRTGIPCDRRGDGDVVNSATYPLMSMGDLMAGMIASKKHGGWFTFTAASRRNVHMLDLNNFEMDITWTFQ